MDEHNALWSVLSRWRANPFALRVEYIDEEQPSEVAIRTWPMDALARRLLDRGDVIHAKKLVLALGHRMACRTDDRARVLAAMPDIFDRLPRQRSEYLRVVMAAGRCYRALDRMQGASESMRRLREKVWGACFGHSLRRAMDMERVIRDHDVLLLGETGTGKELVAQAILAGAMGDETGGPAPKASLNAAAVPETLVESELFGHVRGAYTGATEARKGRIRSADGGCLFLDEVGDLPRTTQVKLLRVIETNEVHPLGSDATHHADVRYVAATHKALGAMVEAGRFRQDLFERLAGNVIRLPPLRERPEDMLEIGKTLVEQYLGAGLTEDDDAGRLLAWLESPLAHAYAWPGNVRELQNAIRNLMLGLGPGLRSEGTAQWSGAVADRMPPEIQRGEAPLQRVREWYIGRVADACDGNMTEAAKVLGIDRTTVRRYVSGPSATASRRSASRPRGSA